MAHGAGSSEEFLARAFPARAVGVAGCRYVSDRTGHVGAVMSALAAAADTDVPTILGGVSLGAHAAARLLARPDLPSHIVGGLLVMPAWTGPPDAVAAMTGAAAAAVSALGPPGVLAELDPDDWVTPELVEAWALRGPGELAVELAEAAGQPGPGENDLARIPVPVGLVALRDDPLHPQTVVARWAHRIPRSASTTVGRSDPAGDLAVFGRAARDALSRAWVQDPSSSDGGASDG